VSAAADAGRAGESENAALIRRMLDLYNQQPTDANQRHGSEIERELHACFADNVTFVQPGTAAGAGLFSASGADGVRAAWDDWLTLWESHHSEIVALHDRGERMLVLSKDRLKGRDGIELDMDGAGIYTVREGQIVRFEMFPNDLEKARAAFEAGAG
jgi:ketosteroid isomerase-like protein